MSQGECVVFNDLANDPAYTRLAHRKHALAAGFRSNFYIPILIKHRAAGFFNFLSREPNKFPPNDIELIKAICLHVGGAFDRAQLFAEVRRRAADRSELIDALYAEIKQRNEVEARLRESLAEKETLLKEIHHRVKNNMQVITSLLRLQANAESRWPVADLLHECEARVTSMALVHELLFQSPDRNRVDLAEYLKRLIAHLHSFGDSDSRRIEVVNSLGRARMGVNVAMPCGLILNELVCNAFKHAFPGGCRGKVEVSLAPAGVDALTLSVRDDGAGMPADFDLASASTLGYQLIGALARQLDGKIEWVRERGTWIKITFPCHGVEFGDDAR
jgi:two-component sensor histidine kinase